MSPGNSQDSNNRGTAEEEVMNMLLKGAGFQDALEGAIQTFNIQETVLTLRQSALSIGKYFEEIEHSLTYLERRYQKLRTRRMTALNPFGTVYPQISLQECQVTWREIRRNYNELMWDSRTLATTTARRAEMFREDVIERLRDPTVSLAEKKTELGEFIEDMKQTDKLAKLMAQGFLEIPERIRLFQTLFGNEVATASFKDKKRLDGKIQALNAQIDRLVEKIEACKAEHAIAWKTISESIKCKAEDNDISQEIIMTFGAILGAAGRESLLSKVFSEMKARAVLVISEAELSRAQEQLDTKMEALHGLQADVTNLHHVSTEHALTGYVKAAQTRTKDICGRLEAIAQVWAVIRRDAQMLYEYMEVAERSTEKRFDDLLSGRQRIVPLYQKLEEILKDYAIAIA